MGAGSLAQAIASIGGRGFTRALLVTDAVLADLGVAAKVAACIEEHGIAVSIFSGARPNPTVANVEAGLEILRADGCDLVVSLGGGSPHDCAKAIALVAANGGSIIDYEGVDRSEKPQVPLVAINTTAGTASEMTRFCIITDEKRYVKMAIVDRHVTPILSVNDPELMLAKPKGLTAATGMDALTHAVEAYVSTIATPITDACALQAIRLIAKWLRPAVANGTNIEARDKMAYAEYLAGMAFNNASLGYVHAMAHQLGGFYNLPHGVCNAVLLPEVCDFNLIANPERYADIAEALGEKTEGLSTIAAAEKGIAAIRRLARDVGIPKNLAVLGVKEADLTVMAGNAKKDACQLTNPRLATLEQVVGIFKAALVA